jgi:hypothetical protein
MKTMLAVVLLAFACGGGLAAEAKRPHIIFVMADDMGWWADRGRSG